MPDKRETHLTLDLCLRIGELLLSSGAGAADVTNSMALVAERLGLRRPDVDVTFTSLSMSWQGDPGEPAALMVRQVKLREIDYEDLTRVDHLIRALLAGELDLMAARSEMVAISSSGHHRQRWTVTLGWGVMCASVSAFLGGSMLVGVIALVTAALIDRLQLRLARRRLPFFYQQLAGGGLATLVAVAAAALHVDADPSFVISANIIMLLAGIGFMGGLQDALSGFYITAGARLTESFLATAGIIAGVSGGLALGGILGVDLGLLKPAPTSLQGLPVVVVGSAVCAAAFAWSSYAPWRAVLAIAPLSGVATGAAMLLEDVGSGTTWAAGVAAFLIGLLAYTVSGRIRVPPLVVVVPAIVPMLPGLSIYRGLSLLSGNDPGTTSTGMLAIVGAAATALALAAGVILGEYVAQPLPRVARRLEDRLAGPRLVGPLKSRTRSRATAVR